MIAVIDYGLGNLRSVSKALEAIGAEVEITNNPEKIARAKAIVLPGVGAFKRGMENLERLGIIPSLFSSIKDGKPFLGICLGLQLLFTKSEEYGIRQGLDIIKGSVKKFSGDVKVPHMGWNQVKYVTRHTSQDTNKNESPEGRSLQLPKGVPDESYFYFVHSYYVEPEDQKVAVATTEYGQEFVSVVNKDNVWGVQFHPEKSEKLGLKVLKNFCHDVK